MEKEELVLEIQRIVSQRIISNYAIDLYEPNIGTQFHPILENYDGAGLRHIYKMAVKEELEAQYPSDWWQAFKERWFPNWLLGRYPVRYTQIIAKHKFPHWEKELGKERVQVIYRKLKEDNCGG